MTLVLGAGLAGLSAAHHLDGQDVVVLEREDELGGLCRSVRENGFTFDYTGHLLHLRDEGIRTWVRSLLPDGWAELHRSAWVATHGQLTPYPFQVNTAGLPLELRLECLLGFIETLKHPEDRGLPVPAATPVPGAPPFLQLVPPPAEDEPSFHDWILRSFGEGFAKHFFEPYNRKLWKRDLREVTGDWVSWSIPRPELADVLRGALVATDKAYGYNPDFLYPAKGGIDHLPRSIAATLPDGVVRLQHEAVALDAQRGRVEIRSATGTEAFDAPRILTSLPLDALAAITTDLPPALADAAGQLSCVSVRAINLGVRGPPLHPGVQWVYVADPAVPFHRIGVPSALTPAMAPDGHHALVAEIATTPDQDPGAEAHLDATLDALVELGFLGSRDDVVQTRVMEIPHAYVVFDGARRRVLPELYHWYLERNVIPMGRYGTWDYLAMQDSLVHGRELAAWIRER